MLKKGDEVKIKLFKTYGEKGIVVKLNDSRTCNHEGVFPVIVKTYGGKLPGTEVGFLEDELEVINHA